MAKAPKPGNDTIEDAELLNSVDASDPGAPLILTEPERIGATPEPEIAPEPPAAQPEKAQDPVSPPRRDPPPPPRQSVFLPLVLGGALAAAGGFAASHYNLLDLAPQPSDTSELTAALAEQGAQIAALTAEVAQLANAPAPDAALADRVAQLETTLSALASAPPPPAEPVDLTPLADRLQAMEARLSAMESLPVGDGTGVAPAALAALQAEIAALKSGDDARAADLQRLADEAEARIAETEARAAALSESLATTAAAAAARAALGRLQAALETGAPFESALADLGDAEVPDVLQQAAASGLPTLSALRETFPPAARQALEAALRANMGESWTERVSAFLRTQTGARSLAPREGSDPDAILSRAEAALAAGDVAAALTEAKGLPEVGLAAMADWITTAEQRLAAETAVTDLVSRLGN